MTTYRDREFIQFFDREGGSLYRKLNFINCTFINCSLSPTKSPRLCTIVQYVQIVNCSTVNCLAGPTVFEHVTIDGLDTNDLLILPSPMFNRVVIKGRVGRIKINSDAFFVDCTTEAQAPFDLARSKFYENVDWALDISQAEFREFEVQGIPSRLIRRDPETQVVITREKALESTWRDRLSSTNTFWPFVIDLFLRDGDSDTVLVAPKGRRSKRSDRLLAELMEIRDAGVAEPD